MDDAPGSCCPRGTRSGPPPSPTERYVRAIFANLAEELGGGHGDLGELARAHATPGGISERFRAMLDEAGVFATVGRSLPAVYNQLQVSEEVRDER